MKKYYVLGLAAVAVMLFTGCETMNRGHDDSQDQQIQEMITSNRETVRNYEQRSSETQRQLAGLQENYTVVIDKLNSLQRQINYVYKQNQEQAEQISNLQKSLAQEQQQRQASMNRVINTVAEQTSQAMSKAAASRNTASASSSSSKISQSSSGPVGSGEFYKYKVQPGATLSAIARAYKVSVDDIKRANRLKSSMIRVGQTLYIPKK
ncbi:MAG: LysM peptidoglycan-binding domain-containing protein [Lentisphaerae bacterium]|nr:LysM peptidoglycan-binding domain-containing protein [Lentisphaerota bacterium]MCP4102239.1 LysM peptidoglycan-binding domain-containing protein [Lentisphaerota bacterium]